MSKPKRAYRYEVIDHGGSGTKSIGDSPYILDWHDLGKEYTWTFYNLKTMEAVGFITGRLKDKGWLTDGTYKSDAELRRAEREAVSTHSERTA